MPWHWLRILRSRRPAPRKPILRWMHRPALEGLEDRLVLSSLPDGFTETQVASGLSDPTAMELAPDGRLFVAEQGGQLRIIKNGTLLATPFVSLSVNAAGERGLLGVTFDPDFARNQYVYVYYTTSTAPVHNRLSRFTANGDVAVTGSEVVLLELNPLSNATNHNGGAIHFGPDGKLYIGAGENANGANAQTLSNLLGKLLRLNADGSIPADNPFVTTATGVNRAIWALGLRNPFTFAFQPGTGRLFINDVGERTWEEINEGVAGANYGWPDTEGPTTDPRFRSPLTVYGHGNGDTVGCAIAGGTFYNPATTQFPSTYVGAYFFADLCGGWIRVYDPATGAVTGFATDLSGAPVDLKVDPVGNLYYLVRGAGEAGVYRVQYIARPVEEDNVSSDNAAFVANLYLDLLGRPVDAAGRVTFQSIVALGNFADINQTAANFVTSTERRAGRVAGYYTTFLGRNAAPAEVNGWLQTLTQGRVLEQVLGEIAGSSESFLRQGSSNSRWLDALYQALLGRGRDPGAQGFLDALNRGATRQGIVAAILASEEYLSRRVQSTYSTYLGRLPGAAEVAGRLSSLRQSPVGVEEPLVGSVVASAEYFRAKGNSNALWVTGLYNDVLGRNGTPAELNSTLDRILSGYRDERLAVASALLESAEYRAKVIAEAYTRYLGRAASQAEISAWLGVLAAGAGSDQLLVTILNSDEYFRRQGGVASRWLDQVYRDLLERERDPSSANFLNALNNGTLTRAQVVAAILTSSEHRRLGVRTIYTRFLIRSASVEEIHFWAERLQQGLTETQFSAAVLASHEYFQRPPRVA